MEEHQYSTILKWLDRLNDSSKDIYGAVNWIDKDLEKIKVLLQIMIVIQCVNLLINIVDKLARWRASSIQKKRTHQLINRSSGKM